MWWPRGGNPSPRAGRHIHCLAQERKQAGAVECVVRGRITVPHDRCYFIPHLRILYLSLTSRQHRRQGVQLSRFDNKAVSCLVRLGEDRAVGRMRQGIAHHAEGDVTGACPPASCRPLTSCPRRAGGGETKASMIAPADLVDAQIAAHRVFAEAIPGALPPAVQSEISTIMHRRASWSPCAAIGPGCSAIRS